MAVLPSLDEREGALDTWLSVLDLAVGAGPERLVEGVLAAAAGALRATKACVAVFRAPYRSGDSPVWAVTVGCDGAAADAVSAHFSSAILERTLEGGRAFAVPSALGDPRFSANHSVRLGRITSVVCAPLTTHTPAVLCVQNPARGVYQRDEIARVEQLARKLSPLVDQLPQFSDARGTAFRSLVGRSSTWIDCVTQLERLAVQDAPVLLVGEPGSGRRTLARALHLSSARATGPRVDVRASQLTEEVVAQAEGGSLVVEELEGLTEAGRAVLLDLLGRPMRLRPRVIATRAEGAPARAGELDALLFRAVVTVPSLEQRPGDAAGLVEELGRKAAEVAQLPWLGCTAAAVDRLRRRRWPRNVAELEQVMGRAVALARGAGPVGVEHLVFDAEVAEPSGVGAMGELFPDGFMPWKEAKHRFEDWYLQRALREFGGHRAITAAQLQMGRATLFEVLKRTGGDMDEEPC